MKSISGYRESRKQKDGVQRGEEEIRVMKTRHKKKKKKRKRKKKMKMNRKKKKKRR